MQGYSSFVILSWTARFVWRHARKNWYFFQFQFAIISFISVFTLQWKFLRDGLLIFLHFHFLFIAISLKPQALSQESSLVPLHKKTHKPIQSTNQKKPNKKIRREENSHIKKKRWRNQVNVVLMCFLIFFSKQEFYSWHLRPSIIHCWLIPDFVLNLGAFLSNKQGADVQKHRKRSNLLGT